MIDLRALAVTCKALLPFMVTPKRTKDDRIPEFLTSAYVRVGHGRLVVTAGDPTHFGRITLDFSDTTVRAMGALSYDDVKALSKARSAGSQVEVAGKEKGLLLQCDGVGEWMAERESGYCDKWLANMNKIDARFEEDQVLSTRTESSLRAESLKHVADAALLVGHPKYALVKINTFLDITHYTVPTASNVHASMVAPAYFVIGHLRLKEGL